jgi:hypothetical protein
MQARCGFGEHTPDRGVLYVDELAFDADLAADATRELAVATSTAIDPSVAAEARRRRPGSRGGATDRRNTSRGGHGRGASAACAPMLCAKNA